MIHATGLPPIALVGTNAAEPGQAAATSAGGSAGDFASMLSNLLTDTVEAVHGAEVAAADGLSGRVPLQEVVDRVMTAEQSLQSALAVRDKVVTAYLEISRMSI